MMLLLIITLDQCLQVEIGSLFPIKIKKRYKRIKYIRYIEWKLEKILFSEKLVANLRLL